MEVKSAFLNGFIGEEVFVKQPPGFKNPNFPYHVLKLLKALHDRLSNFLLNHDLLVEKFIQLFFMKRSSFENLIIQIYVDDISFGSDNISLFEEFSYLCKVKFEMSNDGRVNFFSRTTNISMWEKYIPFSNKVMQRDHSKIWQRKLQVIRHSHEFHLFS